MARLRKGERFRKENQVQGVLYQHNFGLHEVELACELGWDRRTVNNYLRELKQQGRDYKEGRSWFAEY